MVKKGQAKGGKPGGGGNKKPAPLTTGGDDSFIVFSNSDKEPKQKKPGGGSSSTDPSGQDGPALAGEGPKRPDVKKIIGGASWTGKLPVNMLSEHCQKQRWDKPDYSMVCLSILSKDHPLTLLPSRPKSQKGIPQRSHSRRKIQRHKNPQACHRSSSHPLISTLL